MSAQIIEFPRRSLEPKRRGKKGKQKAEPVDLLLEAARATLKTLKPAEPEQLTAKEIQSIRRMLREHEAIVTECPVARRIIIGLQD